LTLTSPLRIAYDDQWAEVVDVFATDLATSIVGGATCGARRGQ
jgi:hypothetical protein